MHQNTVKWQVVASSSVARGAERVGKMLEALIVLAVFVIVLWIIGAS